MFDVSVFTEAFKISWHVYAFFILSAWVLSAFVYIWKICMLYSRFYYWQLALNDSISEIWQETLMLNHKLNKWHCILACSYPMSYSYPLDNNGQKRIDHMGWTRDLCILNNFSNPILTSTCSHPREMGSNLLQPKGDWVYLSFQYSSSCWNPPYPVTKFTLFLW